MSSDRPRPQSRQTYRHFSLIGTRSSQALIDAVNYAQERNVLVVAAAGNTGASDVTYPASHPGVIGVAATGSVEELSRNGAIINLTGLPRIPDTALRSSEPVPWVQAEDWKTGEPLWVPHEMISTDYTLPLLPGTGYFQANTHGLAAGTEEVIREHGDDRRQVGTPRHAACQLVEHAVRTIGKSIARSTPFTIPSMRAYSESPAGR